MLQSRVPEWISYLTEDQDVAPGGKAIFCAVGVLLKVLNCLQSLCLRVLTRRDQATRGESQLYDDIESLFEKIKGYLERVSIQLPKVSTARTAPSPALMNVFADTLVQVFIAIAITTKYCGVAFEGEPGYKKIARNVLRRTSETSPRSFR